MTDELAFAGNALLNRLLPLVAQDPELLLALRELAIDFLNRTASISGSQADEAATESAIDAVSQEAAGEPSLGLAEPASVAPRHVTLPMNAQIEVPAARSRQLLIEEPDLTLIAQRCRLKAEGARWAFARQGLIRNGANYQVEIEPRDRDLVAKAREVKDCFLWMNHFNAPIPLDIHQFEDLAGCYESMAMAIALVRQLTAGPEHDHEAIEKAYDLAAEAQSALRVAIEAIDAKPDGDQKQVFEWLRRKAHEQQIFIPRYMRLDDSADPAGWHDLEERVSQLEARVEDGRKQAKLREKTIKKGQYHARRLRNGNGTLDDWKKVIDVVDSLVAERMPPSNLDLRDMLVPIIDSLPEEIQLPDGFKLVMGEIDRYLSAQAPPTQQVVRETSEEVRKVAALYDGKTLVIIGGECRPYSYEAIKASFGLKELIWIATREHESIDIFLPYIKRDDVNAVLLAIRWSSHSYGEVKLHCDYYGKEFFRLPAGYNPNQVAHQILLQRGELLA